MDLGFFESSRLRYWLWICVPALVAVAVTVGSMAWVHRERKGLEARQALLADLPLLEVQVRKAEELLKSTTPAGDRTAQGTEAVTRRLDQAAQKAGLTLRSVKFGETGQAAGGFVSGKITVQIQGPLRAVVQWLDEIQKPGVLLGVGQAELLALSLPPDDTFSGEISLMVYLRSL
jgi:hypothetical protein